MADPKTVKVRIAVAVDRAGNWYARGSKGSDDNTAAGIALRCVAPGGKVSILTAELLIPEPDKAVEIAAQVEESKP